MSFPAYRLPAYEIQNALLNLQPINQAIDAWDQRTQRNVENERADRQLGFQQQRLDMDRERVSDDKLQKARERAGNLALLTLQEPDEGRRAQRWQQFVDTHPEARNLDQKYHDARTGPLAVLADAGMAQQYLDYQMRRAAEQRAGSADSRANAEHRARMAQYANMSPQSRIEAAPTLGLKPGTSEYNAFIASGQYTPGESMKLNIVPEGGTLVATNPRTGTHQTIVSGGPKPIKEHESKDAMWAERLIRSDANIDKIAGIDPATGKPLDGAYNPARNANRFAPDSPGIWNLYTANLLNSKNWQLYQQAAREGIAAMLRKDTGAAVTETEWNLYFPMLYPQPGDSPEVVLQKKRSREAAAQGMRTASNSAFDRMYPQYQQGNRQGAPGAPSASGAPAPGAYTYDPATGQLVPKRQDDDKPWPPASR